MSSKQLFEELKSKFLKIENKKLLEKTYYEGLSICLSSGQFESFKELLNASIDFNLFIDIKSIPKRFKIIINLILNCIDKVSTGYQTSALGEIIDILRFCNEYNLLEKELSESEKKQIEHLEDDKVFIANLNDLFGIVSKSCILYVYKVIPEELYKYFIKSSISYFPDHDGLMYFIKNIFFNQYTIYGLSIRYLSPIDNFINVFKKNFLYEKNQFMNEENQLHVKDKELIEFEVFYKYRTYYYDTEEEHEHHEIKKHLVSPKNINKNLNKIFDEKNYNFYSLSMVLHGGLGPQGLGFTYSTPKGEVIEICSDIKQNKAIIIKFKKFLKTQFFEKLGKELKSLHVRDITIKKIVSYLTDALDKNDFINYFQKESILNKINDFLVEDSLDLNFSQYNLKNLVNKITNAIHVILRPIKMIDQYKARMDLVAKGLLKSEDIAKLTSLKEKSHYDILRERFFFQNIVNWFYEIYINNGIKNRDKD